jgi:hypothetical protein
MNLICKDLRLAAHYVAGDLDDRCLSAFETHLFGCPLCLCEAEIWRAIKIRLPFSASFSAYQLMRSRGEQLAPSRPQQ